MASGTFYPAVSGDDGWVTTGVASGNSYTYIGKTTRTINCWFRFPNVTIPQGSSIKSAYIKLTAYQTLSGATVNSNVFLADEDNASSPSSVADFNGRSLTSGVAWDAIAAWTQATQYDSPDLANDLQEVVDRGGFSSGNAVMVMIFDDGSDSNAYRTVSTIDYVSGAQKAELHVEWEVPDIEVSCEPLTGTFTLNSAGASTGDIVTAEPLTGAFSLTSAGGRLWDGIVHTEPFAGTFSLSADVRLIQRTLFNSTFILITSLKIGSTLSIVNSLNTQLTSNIDLKLSILQNLEANFGIKMSIEELSKFNDTMSLLNHIFDADSGITQGQYYFLKSHGL